MRGNGFSGLHKVHEDDLGKPRLTREKAVSLPDDLEMLKKNISNVAELLIYLDAKNYQSRGKDTHVDDGDILWSHNNPSELTIKLKRMNCGGAVNLAQQLLMEHYDEVGFIWNCDRGGGHIVNYIIDDSETYIMDFTQYVTERELTVFEDSFKNYTDAIINAAKQRGRELFIVARILTGGQDPVIGIDIKNKRFYFPGSYQVIPLYQADDATLGTREINRIPSKYNTG